MPDYASQLPENYYFGGGGGTFATPLAVAFLVLALILILVLPKKYAFVPFLLAGILISTQVTIVFATLHINSIRLLVLAGLTRLTVRREYYSIKFNSLDKIILLGALVNSIAYSILWQEFRSVVNRAGFLFSTLGTYFILRSLIRTKEDTLLVIKVFLFVVMLITPLMWIQHMNHGNVFSLVGASEFSDLRNGRIRASGPFSHAIIAGTFGVVLLPLFVGLLWYKPRARIVATLGIASSIIMVISSSSSTPLLALPAAVLALAMWPLREKMRVIRWGIVLILISLQLLMNNPIWFLTNRISGVLGGSGWHRTMLIDNFVRHFFEWWLIGTRNNANWGWSMWDVDNAYVGAGLSGGLLGFILFLGIFVHAYRMIGSARVAAEKSPQDARLIWALGASLFANTIAFFGIVYFDQSIIAWYSLLVMISVVHQLSKEEKVLNTIVTNTVMPNSGNFSVK